MLDMTEARELYLYTEGTRPFMDKLVSLNKEEYWETKLQIVREVVREAAKQYRCDYCSNESELFSVETQNIVINQIAKDLGILEEVC